MYSTYLALFLKPSLWGFRILLEFGEAALSLMSAILRGNGLAADKKYSAFIVGCDTLTVIYPIYILDYTAWFHVSKLIEKRQKP